MVLWLFFEKTFLFTGTIAENISLHRPGIKEADVRSAAEKTHADHFIRNLPHGYQEQILESGKRLSAGQRQLLALTRALTAEPELVIMDEATANIDSESERLIEHAVEGVTRGRTVIIIAHRLSTICHADTIVAVDDDRIVEMGTHVPSSA